MTMTRVSFCKRCYIAGRPKTNDQFVVWGDRRQSLIVYQALRIGRRGFTPHIYEFKRLVDKTVYYDVSCGMGGCDSFIEDNPKNKNQFNVHFKRDNGKMNLSDWNYLVGYKRDSDFEI